MKIRRIFTQIWRINAVIILLGGLLASSVMAVTLLTILQSFFQTRRVENIVNVSESPNIESTAQLGNFERIVGSTILRAPLYRQQSYDQDSASRSYSKETNAIENYLFFNELTKTTYWLKPRTTVLILSEKFLSEAPESNNNSAADQRPPVAFLYLMVEADTNNDKRLTEFDRTSLALSDASGLRFKVLIPEVDQLHGASRVQNQRVSILYSTDKKLKIADINLQTQTIDRTVDAQTF